MGPGLVQYDQLESGLLRRKAYEAYFGYKKWSRQMREDEVETYSRLYGANLCREGCGEASRAKCVRGLCECQEEHRSGLPVHHHRCNSPSLSLSFSVNTAMASAGRLHGYFHNL